MLLQKERKHLTSCQSKKKQGKENLFGLLICINASGGVIICFPKSFTMVADTRLDSRRLDINRGVSTETREDIEVREVGTPGALQKSSGRVRVTANPESPKQRSLPKRCRDKNPSSGGMTVNKLGSSGMTQSGLEGTGL